MCCWYSLDTDTLSKRKASSFKNSYMWKYLPWIYGIRTCLGLLFVISRNHYKNFWNLHYEGSITFLTCNVKLLNVHLSSGECLQTIWKLLNEIPFFYLLFCFTRFLTITVCKPYIITFIKIFRIPWRIRVVKSSTQTSMNFTMVKGWIESWMTLFSIVLCALCFPDCIPVLLRSPWSYHLVIEWWILSSSLPPRLHLGRRAEWRPFATRLSQTWNIHRKWKLTPQHNLVWNSSCRR